MIKKLKKTEVKKHSKEELTLNRIEREVEKLAAGNRDNYIFIVNTLNANLTRAMEKREVQ